MAVIHLNGPADEVLLVPPRTVLKTSSGKIRRNACRELYEKGLLEAPRRAVWLQLAGLIQRAGVASLRRIGQGMARVGYGIYCWLVFLLFSGGGLNALALLSVPQARYCVAHIIARKMLRTVGIPVSVDALEHLPAGKPAVLVVNHASYIDAMVLVATLTSDVHFATKHEFARMPLFGFTLRRLGTYFVERVDPAREVEDTRELAGAVERGETVIFFPEGTFSRAPGLATFRLGAFVVSAEAHVPVVPIVLRGEAFGTARSPLAPLSLSGGCQRAATHYAVGTRLVSRCTATRPGQRSHSSPMWRARPHALPSAARSAGSRQ